MWFRWHHGTVNDPKFGKIAKIADTSVAVVLAVWATLLECASAQDDTGGTRGEISGYDPEAIDYLLALDDGTTQKIVDVMHERGLLSGNKVTSWDKRQVKRERDRTEYNREYARERRDRADNGDGKMSTHVNPCQPTSTQKSPRGEESRVEESREDINYIYSRDSKINKRCKGGSATSAGVEKTRRRDDAADTSAAPSATFSEVMQLWNEHLATRGFAKITRSTSARQRAFRARVKEDAERRSLDWWLELMRSIYRSSFLRENARSNWLTIDWILKEANLTKISEGKYLRSNGAAARSPYEDAAASDPDEILAEMFGKYQDEAAIDITPRQEAIDDG